MSFIRAFFSKQANPAPAPLQPPQDNRQRVQQIAVEGIPSNLFSKIEAPLRQWVIKEETFESQKKAKQAALEVIKAYFQNPSSKILDFSHIPNLPSLPMEIMSFEVDEVCLQESALGHILCTSIENGYGSAMVRWLLTHSERMLAYGYDSNLTPSPSLSGEKLYTHLTALALARVIGKRSPLIWAAEHGLENIVERFLSKKPEQIPLKDAIKAFYKATSSEAPIGIIKKLLPLLQKNDLLNQKYPNGCTPLTAAVRKENLEAVSLLIKAGAKIDLPENTGKTALCIARDNNLKEIAQLLEENGTKATPNPAEAVEE